MQIFNSLRILITWGEKHYITLFFCYFCLDVCHRCLYGLVFFYILLISQVQNLTLRSQKLGVLSSSQNGPPKSSSQTQSLSLCPNKPVTSSKGSQPDPSESNRKGESPTPECRSTPVTRTSSIHHLITPGRMKTEL